MAQPATAITVEGHSTSALRYRRCWDKIAVCEELDPDPAMLNIDPTPLSERAAERRRRMTVHIAANWKDADEWDLEFWQLQGPEARLSALVALRNDLAAVRGDNPELEGED